MGWASLAGSFLGSKASLKGAKNAMLAQEQAMQRAIKNEKDFNKGALGQIDTGYGKANEQIGQGYADAFGYMNTGLDQYNQNINPYIQTGNQALGKYGNLFGMGGADLQSQAMAELENSPYFQSISRQGENAILQNSSATGGLRGGNTQRALSEFRPQMLRQEIDRMAQYYNNLMGQGYNAINAQGQMGGQYAQGLSGLATGRGSALGNLSLGQMGDINNLNRQTASALQGYEMGRGQNEAMYQTTRGNIRNKMWNDAGQGFDKMGQQILGAFTGGFTGGGGVIPPQGQGSSGYWINPDNGSMVKI